MYRGMTNNNSASNPFIAGLIFIVAGGGIWGILFALLVKNPSLLKSFLLAFFLHYGY